MIWFKITSAVTIAMKYATQQYITSYIKGEYTRKILPRRYGNEKLIFLAPI